MIRSSLVALAALALVPSSAAAAGGSCNRPLGWTLSKAQLKKVQQAGSRTVELRHGPISIVSGGNPLSSGPVLSASTAGRWRICSLAGVSGHEGAWAMPGTLGTTTRTSFAMRQLDNSDPDSAIAVNYARRRPESAGCGNPRVAYYDADGDTVGDTGASLRVDYSGDMRANALASWSLLKPDWKICDVQGYSAAGIPWVIGAGGPGETEGSHEMHSNARVGTHADPILYFWISFRR